MYGWKKATDEQTRLDLSLPFYYHTSTPQRFYEGIDVFAHAPCLLCLPKLPWWYKRLVLKAKETSIKLKGTKNILLFGRGTFSKCLRMNVSGL